MLLNKQKAIKILQYLEQHEENPFKRTSYLTAIETIKSSGELDKEAVLNFKAGSGIGKSIKKYLIQIMETGSCDKFNDLIKKDVDNILEREG